MDETPAPLGPPYRIELVHEDVDHVHGTPTHWGPVYDGAYAAIAADAGYGRSLSLLDYARNGLARCLNENSPEDGFSARIVALQNDEWVEVV